MTRRATLGAIGAGVLILALVAGVSIFLAARPHTGRLRTPSGGMLPTLAVGSTFTLDYDAYEDAPPRLGDIVVVHPAAGFDAGGGCGDQPPARRICARAGTRPADTLLVKRLVAGPGDRVAIRAGRLIRNGHLLTERYARPCAGEGCELPRPIVVPAGQYVVLGDNRGASDDSRFWGPVRRAWIVGRVDRCNLLGLSCSARR